MTTVSAVLSSVFCAAAFGSFVMAQLDTRPSDTRPAPTATPNATERRARRQSRRRRGGQGPASAPGPVAVTVTLAPPTAAPRLSAYAPCPSP